MARIKYKNDQKYGEFCYNNDFLTKRGKRRYTAEILYRFLTNNLDFVEEHTGLEDAEIEAQILMDCLKSMSIEDGVLWWRNDRGVKPFGLSARAAENFVNLHNWLSALDVLL